MTESFIVNTCDLKIYVSINNTHYLWICMRFLRVMDHSLLKKLLLQLSGILSMLPLHILNIAKWLYPHPVMCSSIFKSTQPRESILQGQLFHQPSSLLCNTLQGLLIFLLFQYNQRHSWRGNPTGNPQQAGAPHLEFRFIKSHLL